jgi:F0F1-type ATP synthase assembly protein I
MDENKIYKFIDEAASFPGKAKKEITGSRYLNAIFKILMIVAKLLLVLAVTIGIGTLVGFIVAKIANSEWTGLIVGFIASVFVFYVLTEKLYKVKSH